MTDNIIQAINERVGKKDEKKVEKKEVKKVEKKQEYPSNSSNRPEDLHEVFEKEYKDKGDAKIEVSLVVDGKELKGKSIVDYIDKNRAKFLKK